MTEAASRGLAAGLCLLAGSASAWASDDTIDEIIVRARSEAPPPIRIAPDAAALIATPGDLDDPVRALLALPGISFSGNDLDPPSIRGAGPDDNLYLIDGIPVPILFHELSDSIVSPDTVRTLALRPTAYPAGFGSALGGVIDIGLRQPSDDPSAVLRLNQLKSGLLVEGPVGAGVTAYGSFRQNLAHLFLEDFERSDGPLVFRMPESRDYTVRASRPLGRSRIRATALGSWDLREDRLRDGLPENLALGEKEVTTFDAQALGGDLALGAGMHATATLSRSVSEQDLREARGDFRKLTSRAWALRSRMNVPVGASSLEAGLNLARREATLSFAGGARFCDPFAVVCGTGNAPAPVSLSDDFGEGELFAQGRFELADGWEIEPGMHVVHDLFLDTTRVEPRGAVSFRPGDRWRLYGAAGLYSAAPPDRTLLLLGDAAEAQSRRGSVQATLGQNLELTPGWRLNTELWYKSFEDDLFAGTPLRQDQTSDAYGLDILLARPPGGDLDGWLAISLADGEVRPEEGAAFDNPFAPTISATLAVSYAFGDGWRAGFKYRGQSGDPYTPPIGFEGGVPLFGEPYSTRLDAYHRLDLSAEKRVTTRFADVRYHVDILNVADAENAGSDGYRFGPASAPALPPSVVADREAGIPLFVAFGVDLAF